MMVLSCGHSLHHDCFERAAVMSSRQCPLCCAPVADNMWKPSSVVSAFSALAITPPTLTISGGMPLLIG